MAVRDGTDFDDSGAGKGDRRGEIEDKNVWRQGKGDTRNQKTRAELDRVKQLLTDGHLMSPLGSSNQQINQGPDEVS